MHREIIHVGESLRRQSHVGLYLLTGAVGVLLCLDIWPAVAGWVQTTWGIPWPSGWGTGLTLFGTEYRYALLAALLGGARVLYGVFEGLLAGRVGADAALALAVVAAILIG